MTEYIRKSGKSKWGHYLLKEDGKFVGTTQNVVKFLEGKLPAEVEITESEGEGRDEKVTKVKVINSYNPTNQTKQPKSQYQRNMETRENKHVEMILSYAKDLVIADKAKTLDSAVEGLMIARQRIMDWKGESEGESPSE